MNSFGDLIDSLERICFVGFERTGSLDCGWCGFCVKMGSFSRLSVAAMRSCLSGPERERKREKGITEQSKKR